MKRNSICMVMTMVIVVSVCHAATLHVPKDYSTITKAMVQAQAGDVIQVAPGRYDVTTGEVFPVVMKAGVLLTGSDDASDHEINASGS